MKPRTGPGWLVSSREEGAVKEETGNVLRSMITNVLCVLLRNINYFMLSVGFPGGSVVKKKKSACTAGDPVQSFGWEDPLEKGMANHFSILAWRIPWTEEPGML